MVLLTQQLLRYILNLKDFVIWQMLIYFPYTILYSSKQYIVLEWYDLDRFYSTADMLTQYAKKGWEKTLIPRGFSLCPPSDIASGFINVWGNPETLYFMESDITFKTDLMERYYYSERCFQITFVEDMTVTYYEKKAWMNSAKFGLFCHVGNRPRPWYKRFLAGTNQKGTTIAIMDTFLVNAGLALTDEVWDQAAIAINQHEISLPSLAHICHDVKYASIADEAFPFYLHAKGVEAVCLLLNYAFSQRALKPAVLSSKSLYSAKEAMRFLSQSYVNPPVIETLARTAGIDKKTLQKAVQHLTGQTINEYIRSLRMEKALSLLMDGTMRVDEIAAAVGYHSKMNFYRAFHDTFGCTPRELKKY